MTRDTAIPACLRAQRRTVGAAALLVALAVSRCTFFSDLVTPLDLSSARVSLLIRDLQGPVAGALVTLDGTAKQSDNDGRVLFTRVPTGSHHLTVVGDSAIHEELRRTLSVELDGVHDTLLLNRRPSFPRIESFQITPDSSLAANDAVRVTFWVRRGGWSPLSRVRIWFNYPDAADTASVPLESDSSFRSLQFVYNAGGIRTIRVVAYSHNGDSALSERSVDISSRFRPSIEMRVLSPGVFYHGVINAISVRVRDPDATQPATIVIDWGDASSPEVFGADSGVFPHTYVLDSLLALDTFSLSVTARDEDGLSVTQRRQLLVSRIDPLLLGPTITYLPGDTMRASVPVVAVGITVLSTPGHIDSITWWVNRFSSDTGQVRMHVQTYTAVTGTVEGGGRYFEASLPTAGLPEANQVRIRVRDSFGQGTEPVGWFYIIGE